MGQGYVLPRATRRKKATRSKALRADGLLKAEEDTPRYKLIFIEDPEPTGLTRAKGVSEVATVLITPAILNAVSRAVGASPASLAPAGGHLEAIRTGNADVPTMAEQVTPREVEKILQTGGNSTYSLVGDFDRTC